MKVLSNEKILVVCGNHRQFEQYCREIKYRGPNIVFASSEQAIQGFRPDRIIRYGEWYKNPVVNSSYFKFLESIEN